MAVKYVLDTNAILYLLGGRLAIPLEPGNYHVSVISEMELLSYPDLTANDENQLRAFLASVMLVELTTEVKSTAIELRRCERLKLPDAIIAASALVLDAELLTNDQQLLRISGIRGRSLQLKP
jgi:predicted nucleic acid-binding protein